MENINENEMININGGGVATNIFNTFIENYSKYAVTRIDIHTLKESTIRNLTNKLGDNGYISTIHKNSKEKYIMVTKRA